MIYYKKMAVQRNVCVMISIKLRSFCYMITLNYVIFITNDVSN